MGTALSGLACITAFIYLPARAADGPPSAVAAEESTFGVHDRGALFGPDAVRRAEDVVRQVRRDHRRDVLVETYPTLDGIPRGPEQEKDRNAFCTRWMERRGRELGVRGLMVLVVADPPHVQVYVGRTTTQLFTQADREDLIRAVVPALAGKRFDEALGTIVGMVKDRMDRNDPPAEPGAGAIGRADGGPIDYTR